MIRTTKFKATVLIALNVATIIVGVIAIILLIGLLGKINQQVIAAHSDSEKATNVIESDLSCLGSFFSQPQRENLRISNLHSCKIINIKTGKTFKLSASPVGAIFIPSSSPAEPSIASSNHSIRLPTNQNQNPTPREVAVVSAQVTGKISTPKPAPQEHPRRILGIPLCIPLTNRCLYN